MLDISSWFQNPTLAQLAPYGLDLLYLVILVGLAYGANYALIQAAEFYLRRLYYRDGEPIIVLKKHFAPWSFFFLFSLFMRAAIPTLYLSVYVVALLKHVSFVSTMLCGGILTALSIRLIKILITHNFDNKRLDNMRSRALQTQVQFIEKLVFIVIGITVLSVTLASFEAAREIGGSILASAGIVGVVAGFAAQRSLANLFAGFQIAFTQPIRLDDVVVVENQWGRIEEITFTYVVVCLWDLRRLVLPINYFMEKPFENWTRNTANLLAYVLLHFDYSFPVDALRKEFERTLQSTELWDGQVSAMQIVDSTDKTMVIRALMSARNSGQAFDLKCIVRERLIAFVQREYPHCLPQLRVESDIPNGPMMPPSAAV